MDKTPRGVMIGCMALLLASTAASAVQHLKSLQDLQKIKFGTSVPKHSAVLLYWFANEIDIDNNNNIWLTFDPNLQEYGSHHFGNYEEILDPLPLGNRNQYYTVGNIHPNQQSDFPSYVLDLRSVYNEGNVNRIVFRVMLSNSGRDRIEQVYMTQHFFRTFESGNAYDPHNTYRIHLNLLRQIREFSRVRNSRNSLRNFRDQFESDADNARLDDISNTWGDLAGLGLFLFILFRENNACQRRARPRPVAPKPNVPGIGNNSASMMCCIAVEKTNDMVLKVAVNKNGTAKIIWKNVPRHHLQDKVMVVLYRNDRDNVGLAQKSIANRASGTYDTSICISEGLQVRLHAVITTCFFWSSKGEELNRGAEFRSPEPVDILGYNARLQLFAENGKACVRLYIGKTVNGWMSLFEKSWVGFYSSAQKSTGSYEWWQWQWVTRFKPNVNLSDETYDVYEYQSSMTAAPGVQARFILRNEDVYASTPSWEEPF